MRERDGKLSTSTIKYLLALYELDKNGTGARSIDIADKLKLSKPSVHTMLNKLILKGYVEKQRYEAVYLTETGRNLTEKYASRFKLLQSSLQATLKLSQSDAQNAAYAVLAETDTRDLKSLCLKLSDVQKNVGVGV